MSCPRNTLSTSGVLTCSFMFEALGRWIKRSILPIAESGLPTYPEINLTAQSCQDDLLLCNQVGRTMRSILGSQRETQVYKYLLMVLPNLNSSSAIFSEYHPSLL